MDLRHTAQRTEVETGNTKAVSTVDGPKEPSRFRNYCFTAFRTDPNGPITGETPDPLKQGAVALEDVPTHVPVWDPRYMRYLIIGREVCPRTGRQHLQGFVIFKNPRAPSGVLKQYKPTHFEVCKGTPLDNMNYCRKDGDYQEWGERPHDPGARTDLVNLAEMVRAGMSDREIAGEIRAGHDFGMDVIRHRNGIQHLRRVLGEEMRDWEMDVRIYWGPPRSGKTRLVWEEFGVANVYPKIEGKWWDRYNGQTCVLIDDFDPDDHYEISFCYFLKLLDRYPLLIENKGGFSQFHSRVIVITSNFDPSTWWKGQQNRDAFFERVTEVRKIE